MTRRQGTSQFVAALAPVMLGTMLVGLPSGCGTVGLFGDYDIPESADVAAAPYPRLVDVPEAPPPGVYTPAVPDPLEGVVTQAALGQAASQATARAAGLARTDPGAGVAGQAAVAAAQARAAALARTDPGAGAAGQAVAAAANARAASLSGPVISQADREALLSRARAQRDQ